MHTLCTYTHTPTYIRKDTRTRTRTILRRGKDGFGVVEQAFLDQANKVLLLRTLLHLAQLDRLLAVLPRGRVEDAIQQPQKFNGGLILSQGDECGHLFSVVWWTKGEEKSGKGRKDKKMI